MFPEFSTLPFAESDAKNKAKDDEREKSPVKVRTSDRLFHRHWDSQVENKRQHLFVMSADGKDRPGRDTPATRDAYPTSTTFSVGDDFTFSPDSKFLVFTAVPSKGEAWSTDHDLCRVPVDNAATEWPSLTSDNKGADGSPRFSPDGKKLAWRSQKRAGYEADKWDNQGGGREPGRDVPRHADSADERVGSVAERVRLGAEGDHPRRPETRTAAPRSGSSARPASSTRGGGRPTGCTGRSPWAAPTVAMTWATAHSPPAILLGSGDPKGGYRPIDPNETFLAQLDLPRPESVRVKVEDGEMQMWILKPPGFDPAKKWPVAYLVHGGPQGAWEDGWSYRWNPQVWAAPGVRRRPAQPPRKHRLRPEVRGPDFGRLGAASATAISSPGSNT